MGKIPFIKLVSVIMSIVMLAITPVTVFAKTGSSSSKDYISELCVASNSNADSAKKELTDKGFTVIDNNVNDGTGKEATYIGYKTTKDSSEAITDMRVMDMNGGYSYSEYEETLKKYEETIQKELASYSSSIKEFRELYEAGDEKAVFAYKQLNKLKEDDSGKLIGDLFVEKELDMATLTKVFVQGNSEAIKSIEEIFAIVFSDEWLDTAAQNTSNNYNNATYLDEACQTLIDSWETLQLGLYKYYNQLSSEDGYNIANYTDDSFNTWVSQNNVTEEQANNVILYGSFYQLLIGYETKNGESLAQLFLKSKDELTYNDLYPLADALSEGALQAMRYVGLIQTVSLNDCNIDDLQKKYDENKETIEQRAIEYANSQVETENEKISAEDIPEVQSVYAGVDRTLFDKNGGIALTSDALRAKASTGDSLFNCMNKNKSSQLLLVFGIGIGAMSVFAIIVTAITTYQKWASPFGLSAYNISQFKGIMKYSGIALGIAIALLSASIIIGVHDYYNPKYTPIPRVIVDKVSIEHKNSSGKVESTETKYIAYYATFDAEDTGGGNRKYGDLNGWGAHQWNALYYTKDSRAGTPITTDIIVQYSNNVSPAGYTSLRYFGSNNTPFNINSHAFTSKAAIYVFYAADTQSNIIGSSFSSGYLAISGLVGLIIGCVGTYLITKNKKKEETT